MIGQRLSQFRITAKLGEGGMGVVYRAQDTKLGREVAIKVLPDELTANPERMARFEREARVLATLNHPSIAAIHDLREVDGTHFLVLELVEGEDLATVLGRGPISQAKALHVALQLADALETTHRQGIVHRDLKPGNIMVGQGDLIKVLDFGLAKASEESEGDEVDMTHSPTRTAPMTEAGLIMGTAGYMSPEQARGQAVDKQADIWAFGVVLWEMLAGKSLFDGSSIADMMVAVLKGEIDWERLPDETPAGIRRLLGRCLQRDARQRLHDMGDARIEIEAVMEGEDEVMAAPLEVGGRPRWRPVLATGAVTAMVALAWILLGPNGPPEPGPIFRSDLVLPPGVEIAHTQGGNVRLSPTGDRLVYQAMEDGQPVRLVVRSAITGDSLTLEGTREAFYPFWSPDGEWLAFFADKKLKKVPADGGPVQILADAPSGRGGAWSPEGVIVFAPRFNSPLVMISENGGTPQPVTSPPEGYAHRHPHFLPDGRTLLMSEVAFGGTEGYGRGVTGSIDGGPDRREVAERALNPQFADGYLFFVRDRILMAQAFDPRSLETRGPIRAIAEAVEVAPSRVIANYSVSAGGRLAYRKSHARETQVTWFDRGGRELATVGEPGLLQAIDSVTDDGSLVVLQRRDETELYQDHWVIDLQDGRMVRATSLSTTADLRASLSKSGDRLAVASQLPIADQVELWLQPLTGGDIEPIQDDLGFEPSDWSDDGRYLLGDSQSQETGFNVTYVDLEDELGTRELIAGPFNERFPDLSPDGKWLAYISNETETFELYVTDFPRARRKWRVSRAVGRELGSLVERWSPDGRTLYYHDIAGIFEVAFEGSDPPVIGEPELIIANDPKYNVAHVAAVLGDRILTLRYGQNPPIEPIRFIDNWQWLLEE